MENTAVMLFTKDYTPGNFENAKLTLIAQSESGAYFIPLSTVRPITRPTYFDIG